RAAAAARAEHAVRAPLRLSSLPDAMSACGATARHPGGHGGGVAAAGKVESPGVR
ncbi:unnamed protein product, partial [Urochloa humidicola]